MKDSLTRRSLLAGASALTAARKRVPAGIELYSVRDVMKSDLAGAVRAVAGMGYECVEFYSEYLNWTAEYTREVRRLLDELKLRCLSTHNGYRALEAANIETTLERNRILGSTNIVMASAGRVKDLDDWKRVADTLNRAAERLKRDGMRTGFHNHRTEFEPVGGTRPMDVLARNTTKDVTLQLDVGTCIHAGSDPVEWIKGHPGRIRSLHMKDWAPGEEKDEKGYRVLFGEGVTPWKKLMAAAEKAGGVEFYLIEQEGSRYSSIETAKRCLEAFRKVRG